ncbi:MAG: hypothetical protein ACTHK1_04565 [Actinomycetales bacterium]
MTPSLHLRLHCGLLPVTWAVRPVLDEPEAASLLAATGGIGTSRRRVKFFSGECSPNCMDSAAHSATERDRLDQYGPASDDRLGDGSERESTKSIKP